jgi:hypothetical protein
MKASIKTKSKFFGVLLLSSCLLWGCDPKDLAVGIIKKMEGKTWVISTVTVDGVDRTSDFISLRLILQASNPDNPLVSYTVTSNRDPRPVWPANGTMSGLSQTQVKRDDGVVIDVEFPSDTQMTLTFDWTTTDYGSGRAEGIKGRHVFKFTKQ